jgi:ribosomal protein S18 acetylase RimI-like enzyme
MQSAHATLSEGLQEQQEKRVLMVRNLDDFGDVSVEEKLPNGFSLRWKADVDAWLSIHAKAEADVPTSFTIYNKQFCSCPTDSTDGVLLQERQCFVVHAMCGEEKEVGTCTGWKPKLEDCMGKSGRLHWLAVDPDYQRQGLGTILVEATLTRLKKLGHTSAYLSTWSDKLAAICLYRKAGFEALIRSEEEQGNWVKIMGSISKE